MIWKILLGLVYKVWEGIFEKLYIFVPTGWRHETCKLRLQWEISWLNGCSWFRDRNKKVSLEILFALLLCSRLISQRLNYTESIPQRWRVDPYKDFVIQIICLFYFFYFKIKCSVIGVKSYSDMPGPPKLLSSGYINIFAHTHGKKIVFACLWNRPYTHKFLHDPPTGLIQVPPILVLRVLYIWFQLSLHQSHI